MNLFFDGWRGSMAMALLAAMAIGGTGCDMKMPWDSGPADKKQAAKGEETAEASASDAEGDGEEAAETQKKPQPPPLDPTRLLPSAMRKLPFRELNIALSDRMVLYGRLYDPLLKPPQPATEDSEEESADEEQEEEGTESKKPYAGPRYPLVILLHGLNRDHTAWRDLPAQLVKAGYAVLALDLRGHGKSGLTLHHQRVGWRLFGQEQWLQLPKDIGEAVEFFHAKQAEYPEVDHRRVALIGEKLGANVAIYAGRDFQKSVKALVLMSPSLNYKGLVASQAIVDFESPTLLMASRDDGDSAQVAEKLYNWVQAPRTLQIYSGMGGGEEMLAAPNSAVGAQIVAWLREHFPNNAG